MTESNPLARYLIPLRRWWPIVAATVALGLVGAWITLPEPPPPPSDDAFVQADPDVAYRATHLLIRDRPSAATANFQLLVLLAKQGEILADVIEQLPDGVDPTSIEAVELVPDENLGTLSVTTIQPTAELAALVATTYAEAISRHFDARADEAVQEQIDRLTERLGAVDGRIRQLQELLADYEEETLEWRLTDSELTVLVDQYGQLQTELRNLSTNELGAGSTFATLQEPVPTSTAADEGGGPAFEVPDSKRGRFALASVLALLLGIGLVLVVDRFDTRIRTRQEAEDAFGLPVIAEVPRRSRKARVAVPLPVRAEPGSITAEAFRALRLSVQLATRWQLQREAPTNDGAVGSAAPVEGPAAARALLVTSPVTGEGKSSVSANLAASIAESGQRVLLVDCDFRRSTAPELVGVGPGRGLRDLSDLSSASLEPLLQPTSVPGVALIRAGEPGSSPGWFLAGAKQLVEMAKGLADVVVFDTGPLLATNEASALTPHVDAVLFVARCGRTSREHARRGTEQLTRLHAMVAGIVLVGGGASRTYTYYEPLRRAAAAREAMKP